MTLLGFHFGRAGSGGGKTAKTAFAVPVAFALACATHAAGAAITVNGAAVGAGASGSGWSCEAPVVRLTGPGPFVVSGAESAGRVVLRAESDCTLVVSNLSLSAAGTGVRARADGFDYARCYARCVAEDGAGRSVAVFRDGLYHAAAPTAVLTPDDPAAAFGSPQTWADVWKPSNVLWTPHETNDAAVIWAGERFVAVRNRGGFAFSEDGAAWRAAEWNGTPHNLRAVARDPATGTLVAASTEGLWTSRDGGLRWTQATNLYANAVVWSDSLFVAVGGDDPAQAVYWSPDGTDWRARGFSGQSGTLSLLVADGGGRFLAGSRSGWRALRLESGEPVSVGTASVSATKIAAAAGNGVFVASTLPLGTGLRVSTNGVDWARADKQDGVFPAVVFRGGLFFAEGYGTDGAYAGLWTSANGAAWTRAADGWAEGLPALDCGACAVELAVAGAGNALAGGDYAPAVRVAPGGSVAVSAAPAPDGGAAPAVLEAAGGRWAAAIGGGIDEDAGAFVQRGATLFAEGGCNAPDVGPGAYGAAGGGVTVLGGSLRIANGLFPAPSNGVEAVRCVLVDGLAPGAVPDLANLPGRYGTDGIAADAQGRVWLWLPETASSFRFVAGGSLRRVAAGGGAAVAETLPDPKVEDASFAAAADGALEITLRVASPVEAEALAPVYAADLSALAAGGGERLAPTRVDAVGDGEYRLVFRLPAGRAAETGFLAVRAQ
ncbi:MAG: hypothetical protein IJV65_06955 [Kiritimatiellae bacterium]|nr:hypothetical protein [Kiritimatiellia bacterium]